MPREARSQRLEAIVLKHAEFGEADRLVTLYTRERGKLRALAKGARKARSRKAGHLEPFTRLNLLLASGRNLDIITQAEAIDTHSALNANLETLGYASYVAELADKFSSDEDENRGLYRLLRDTYQRLVGDGDLQLAVRYYEVRLLDLVGFRPQLQHCLSCGKEIQPENQYFSTPAGGVLCPSCGRKADNASPISLDALRYLRHFQRSDYAAATRAQPGPSVYLELETIMDHYLTYLAERALNSPRFLRRVRQANQD